MNMHAHFRLRHDRALPRVGHLGHRHCASAVMLFALGFPRRFGTRDIYEQRSQPRLQLDGLADSFEIAVLGAGLELAVAHLVEHSRREGGCASAFPSLLLERSVSGRRALPSRLWASGRAAAAATPAVHVTHPEIVGLARRVVVVEPAHAELERPAALRRPERAVERARQPTRHWTHTASEDPPGHLRPCRRVSRGRTTRALFSLQKSFAQQRRLASAAFLIVMFSLLISLLFDSLEKKILHPFKTRSCLTTNYEVPF